MTEKTKLIAPRLPRGFEDRTPGEIAAVGAMIDKIKGVYERYGFDPVETPLFEYTEALGKFLPDTDRPNAGVFSLQDDDEQWMSLRYDLTAPLARHFAENFETLPKPYRSYRQGYVFRNERPGPGRFRQFMQFDADTVGAGSPEADAEMCMMMADVMDELGLGENKELGLERRYVVKVSSRRLLDGWRHAFGLESPEFDAKWLGVMRALDKADRLGLDGVQALLGQGRTDDSGDRTPGANLDQAASRRLLQMLTYRGHVAAQGVTGFNPDFNVGSPTEELAVKSLSASIRDVAEYYRASEASHAADLTTLSEALSEIEAMASTFRSAGYDDGRICFDPSVVRGLEYYTGPVFEIELTFQVTNEKGQPVVFGSVGGGGRYDGLVSRFRREPVPATGFSIGVSRLFNALKLTGNVATSEPAGPVVVLVMDKDQTARYQAMVSELRQAGIRAEMFLGNSKNFGKQVSYADKRNSPAVIIEGSQEREQGMVQIKDLIAGKQAAAAITDNAEWKAARPGQFEVKRGDLVSSILKLLSEQ